MRHSWFAHILQHFLPALLTCAVLLGGELQAQATPQNSPDGIPIHTADSLDIGVVWTPPTRPDSALRELDRIDDLGATAVRLTRLPPDTVATRADTLGLELFVDLPVDYVPAPRLRDSLAQAVPTLERLQTLAHNHPSITHVGLVRGADTTVPATCDVLTRWTDRVHDQTSSLRTYYLTPFAPSADRCADAVDRPLLNLRGHPRPAEQWDAWRNRTDSVGIGALGTWTRPRAPSGLRVPHSAERHARYLENTLPRLLDSTRTAPSVVFVTRWQDEASPLLPSRHYGLHDADGTPRPAATVVHGIYSGTQRTFAFPDGSPPAGSYGLVLVGWGLVALLGLLYAGNLVVRQTVVRYFTAPGFYRDALRDGRDASPGANGLLLGLVAGSLGIAIARTAQLTSAHPETEHVLAALPRVLRSALVHGIEHPALAGIVGGGGALALLLLWMGALVATARFGTRFSVAQGLMLVTWPCWPVLLAPPLALATGPDAPLSPTLFALLLLGGGALVLFSLTLRVLYDYWRVTDAPMWTLLPLLALSPLILVSASLLVAVQHGVSFSFLWHLAVYT